MPPTDPSFVDETSREDEGRYLLRGRQDIRQALQWLVDSKALVSASLSPGNRTFPTAVLRVADDDTLLIDGSADDSVNRSILQAHHLTCVAQPDRIRMQFQLHGLAALDIDGQVAFRAALPERLMKLQRRELYRLKVPVSQPLKCTVTVPEADGEDRVLQLRVIDISCGGVSLALPATLGEASLPRELDDCLLHLPEADGIAIGLRVRSLSRQLQPNGTETTRAGCQFSHLPRGADAVIQRYIFRMDRQRSARERGNG
ncbi:c-di-GMP-binding flagellar brake protein YcgR [Luteimonas cucumeris]|uniref:Flagellar brake protein YcgR n=1 Tax=Luteimonas cucumeris TaxID=985012 RepID=A0A562KUK2_9GAMM|nr:flagellar brake protein [Luteimonas cucumeris]TWH98883.1 c-di-GMP-binding flagellar brake protein YcgR [Luteimonas cucumeris]